MRVPVVIRDNSGTTVITSPDAFVTKFPAVEFGKEIATREWVLECGHLYMNVGGNIGKTYDPQLMSMVVGGLPIVGIADGTFIKAERNEDAFKQYIGTDGEAVRARQLNISGKITFTLKQTSPSNDNLSGLLDTDMLPSPL